MDHGLNWDFQSWYADQVEVISTLQEGIERLSATLDTLSPVSSDKLCASGSNVSSIIWGSFGILLLEANPEDAEALSCDQVRQALPSPSGNADKGLWCREGSL
jgi:hypothetical protein